MEKIIKFKKTLNCAICDIEPKYNKKITYGHGESYMYINFYCPKCKQETKGEGNYNGYQEAETVWKALQHWNKVQESIIYVQNKKFQELLDKILTNKEK